MKNKLWSNFWGLFFIFIGIGFGGDVLGIWHFTIFFTGWWTFFIIIPCLISLVQKGYNVGDIIGLLIGIVLLLATRDILNFADVMRLMFPVILIIIGISIIFKDVFKKKIKKNISYKGDSTEQYSVFSSNRQNVTGTYNGSGINAIFGAYTLDLSNAVIDQDIKIKATAIFGGIDIIVPEGVIVQTTTVPIFGGVTNKVKEINEVNAPVVLVDCVSMFGGINIK